MGLSLAIFKLGLVGGEPKDGPSPEPPLTPDATSKEKSKEPSNLLVEKLALMEEHRKDSRSFVELP